MRRQLAAEVVDIAGQHQQRTAGARHVQRHVGERQREAVPLGVARVQRVDDDVRALRGFYQRGLVGGVAAHGPHACALRERIGQRLAGLSANLPAGVGEGAGQHLADAAGSAEDQDGGAHGGILASDGDLIVKAGPAMHNRQDDIEIIHG